MPVDVFGNESELQQVTVTLNHSLGLDRYQTVTTTDLSFFTGVGSRRDVGIQYRVSGVSVQLSPNTYSTTLVFTVDNSAMGLEVFDLDFSDTLPAGVTFTSTSGCVEDPNGVASCTLGTLNPGREIAQPSYSFYKMWYSTRHAATIWVNIPI